MGTATRLVSQAMATAPTLDPQGLREASLAPRARSASQDLVEAVGRVIKTAMSLRSRRPKHHSLGHRHSPTHQVPGYRSLIQTTSPRVTDKECHLYSPRTLGRRPRHPITPFYLPIRHLTHRPLPPIPQAVPVPRLQHLLAQHAISPCRASSCAHWERCFTWIASDVW